MECTVWHLLTFYICSNFDFVQITCKRGSFWGEGILSQTKRRPPNRVGLLFCLSSISLLNMHTGLSSISLLNMLTGERLCNSSAICMRLCDFHSCPWRRLGGATLLSSALSPPPLLSHPLTRSTRPSTPRSSAAARRSETAWNTAARCPRPAKAPSPSPHRMRNAPPVAAHASRRRHHPPAADQLLHARCDLIRSTMRHPS